MPTGSTERIPTFRLPPIVFRSDFGMTLDFGRGARDAQQFCGKVEGGTIIEHNTQRTTILRKADFDRPRRVSGRLAHFGAPFRQRSGSASFRNQKVTNSMNAGRYDN